MASERYVLVFMKAPAPGSVKTRLAATIGAERAAAVYREWIGEVLGKLQSLRPGTRIVACHTGSASAFSAWRSLVDDWRPQPEGDLGARLSAGFAQAPAGSATLAIGADCLEIDDQLLTMAFDRLEAADVTIGPATDGGYYLIGARAPAAGLFAQVRWSTPDAFADQCDRCRHLGRSIAILPTRSDIDTWDDWRRHCERTGRTLP